MEKSLAFYHGILGLKIAAQFSPDGNMKIAMLGEKEDVKVELIENKELVQKSIGISIGFEVDSIETALNQLKDKNFPIKRGPISPAPATTFFYIEDPDGLEIQLVSHKE